MALNIMGQLGALSANASAAGPGTLAYTASQKRTAAAKDQSAMVRALILRALAGGGASLGARANLPASAFRPTGNPAGKGLVTIRTPNGERVTVAANYAGRFSGLLNDLWKAGYHYRSVGGYSYRNIAGTNTLSKHATGEAIDIDPQPNRGNRLGGGGSRYGYFDPRVVNGLIKKWGLDWGGNWSNPDPMHFSTGG